MVGLNRRIAVIDDDEPIRSLLFDFFASQGYAVECFENPAIALRAMTTGEDPRFDLVISDIRMPEMSGIDFFKKMQIECPETPVVLMTAFGTRSTWSEMLTLGVTGYIEKPFSLPQMGTAVINALDAKARAGLSQK